MSPTSPMVSRNAFASLFLVTTLGGCAALTNPVADGVPVRRVPPELLEPSRSAEQTIPPTLLGQTRPATYRLEAGDVLGVYVDGFLGERDQPAALPIHVGPLTNTRDQRVYAP